LADSTRVPDPKVLVIDDDAGSRAAMALAISKGGLPTESFDDARRALEFLQRTPSVRAVVTDLKMPGMDGLAFVRAVVDRKMDVGLLLVTAFGTIETAVEAMRVGADDYLTKPVDLFVLREKVRSAVEKREMKNEVVELRKRLGLGFDSIVRRSPAMEKLIDRMRTVAPTRSTVLILGESGTGKELVANALHTNSPRVGRFVALNCGAIPREILESELFGHEKGSFTGAIGRQVGKIEAANGGTLFLDEIAELSADLQVKLLRVLEDRKITRVGSNEPVEVDFRLLAATNKNLELYVREGRFREDLYFRLKVVTLDIPPLRDRKEDVPVLVEHFLGGLSEEHDKGKLTITPAAMRLLADYRWPGNVRELRNVVENLVIFAEAGGTVDRDDLPPEVRVGASPFASASHVSVDAPRSMADIEKEAILRTLQQTGGRRAEAAAILEIGLRTLQRKLKEYKMAAADEPEAPED
jgi:DNA-binding NtrC family response regulator